MEQFDFLLNKALLLFFLRAIIRKNFLSYFLVDLRRRTLKMEGFQGYHTEREEGRRGCVQSGNFFKVSQLLVDGALWDRRAATRLQPTILSTKHAVPL